MKVKNIVLKIAVLGCLLALLNVIYTHTLWKKDLDKEADMLLELLNKQDSCDIIYFGESSNFRSDTFDVSKKSISEFTGEYFMGLRIGAVDRPAMHAGIYLQVIKNISPSAKVKTLVVTLNMRSFDATWINSNLETALQKSNVMYQLYPPLVNRFMLSLNCYEKKSADERHADMLRQWAADTLHFPYPFPYKTVIEWDKAMGTGGYLNPDGSWNLPKIGVATSYIKTYGFQIDTNKNIRIRDFDEIVEVAKKKNLQLVFNLLAENIQYADSLVGKDLVYLMQQNKKLLVDRYTKKGVLVVDNFELVNGTDYIDQNWTTEHYKERGRRAIAKNLAKHLERLYPGKYLDPTYGNDQLKKLSYF